MQDALALVQEKNQLFDITTFSFFKRNRHHFPIETKEFLQNKIEEDLVHTRKRHYERIAESLDLLIRINQVIIRKVNIGRQS
jgi:hypothetical protein